MHRPIGTVFKVLGIFIIFMVVLDTLMIVGDTLTVNNRIESLALVMQDEASRHNSIPDELRDRLFFPALQEIVNNSNVATNIETNLDRDLTIDGVTYTSISQSNVRDYGEVLTIAIRVEMSPKSFMFYGGKQDNTTGSFIGTGIVTYHQEFIYKVPALRYLK